MPDPRVNNDQHAALSGLLRDLLDQDQLKRLLYRLYGRSVVDDLPYQASTAEFLFAATEMLLRRNLVGKPLFQGLLELPSGKHEEIRAMAARWDIDLAPSSAVLPVSDSVPVRVARKRGRIVFTACLTTFIAAMVFLCRGPRATVLPYPFGSSDVGIADIWNVAREAELTSTMAAGPAGLRSAWPELLHALDAHSDAWAEIRAAGREDLIRAPEGHLQIAGLCLRQALETVQQTLRAIEETAKLELSPPDDAWGPLIHQWLFDLRPPVRCRDSRYLAALNRQASESGLVATFLRGDDHAWRGFDTAGFRNLRAGDLDRAAFNFSRALAAASGDVPAQARLNARLAEVALAQGDLERVRRHLEAAWVLAERGADMYLRFYIFSWTLHVAAKTGERDVRGLILLYNSALGGIERASAQAGRRLYSEEAELHLQMAWAIANLAGGGQHTRCPIECDAGRSGLETCAGDGGGSRRDDPAACARDLVTLAEQGLNSDDPLRADAQRVRADIAMLGGDIDSAIRSAERAIHLVEATGRVSRTAALARCKLAHAYYARDDLDAAEANLRLALGLFAQLGLSNDLETVDARLPLAGLEHTRGAYADALELSEGVRRTLEHYRVPSGFVPQGVEVYALLADLYINTKILRDDALGFTRLRRGIEVANTGKLDAPHRGFLVDMHLTMVRLALRYGDTRQARERLAEAATIAVDIDIEFMVALHWLRAEVDLRAGDRRSAQRSLAQALSGLQELRRTPSRTLVMHIDWLQARLQGPDDTSARAKAGRVLTALVNSPYLADEFLDEPTLSAWLSGASR